MTKRSTGKMTKLRRGTHELLERRGMVAGMAGRTRTFGPVLHTGLQDAGQAAKFGTYAALVGESAFTHGGRRVPEERARMGTLPAHAELKGHRHRGAERHSAH